MGKNGIPAVKMEKMQKLVEKLFKDVSAIFCFSLLTFSPFQPFNNGVYVGAMFVGLLAALLAKAYGWKNKQYVAHLLEHQNAKIVNPLKFMSFVLP